MTSNELSFSDAEIVVSPPEAPSRLTNSSSIANGNGSTKEARPSFTADSPYYTSYVEQEMRQLQVLGDTLREISARAKTFGKCGALMSEATRRLALACRFRRSTAASADDYDDEEARMDLEDNLARERKEAIGDEMGTVLFTLGEVLDEIADAQISMCESLEASLSLSLEAFCGTQLQEVAQLKQEAEQMTENAENSVSKYLNGRHAADMTSAETWNRISEQVGTQVGSTLQKWKTGTDGRMGSAIKNWRNKDDGGSARRSRSKAEADPAIVVATTTANLRLNLEQIRLAQANAELKRFQLLKQLINIKKRRNFELGESALAGLHGIRAYFHHCSDLVQGLSPRMNRIQTTQNASREKHTAQQLPWDSREKGLLGALKAVEDAVTHAGYLAEVAASGDLPAPTSAFTVSELEQETQLWELPALLAQSSRYQREPAPGVMVEGWLFKKSSSRMSLQQWNRRWFMMDKDGIYYFRSSAEIKNANGYLHTLERVKICDVVLCTVREVSNDGLRFCFEIVTPNQKPLLLQARGPLEYKTWVDGIRNAIETQLMTGDRPSENLMQNIGKKKKKRGDGVPDHVPTLASMLESETVASRGGEQNSDDALEVSPPQFRDSDGEEDFNAESDLLERSNNPLVDKVLELNPICADCDAPNPDWASLNLGVLVCIECSGVHRSLGVHVSKMRSLKLDSLSQTESRLLLAMGNDRVNSIWEAGVLLQQGWTKPLQGDSRQSKDNWIKSKYQWKGFLEERTPECVSQEERALKFNLRLYEAAQNADVMGIAECLAYGGNVDWKNPNDDNKTALHACALTKPKEDSEWLGIESAELLIQNGAKVNVMDANTQTALDCTVIGNGAREMVEYLSSRR